MGDVEGGRGTIQLGPKMLLCLLLLPSPSGPTTFVELLPMVSSPSLYGRGQFSIASSSTQLRPLLTTKYEKNCASQCSVGHSCAQRYDSCEGRGGEIICMIGSPRPPMYSPPSTWGAPLLQMSLPPNKTMGEKSGFTLGSLVTAGRTGFMQELNSRGIVRQPKQLQTEFKIKRYIKEGCEVCVCAQCGREEDNGILASGDITLHSVAYHLTLA